MLSILFAYAYGYCNRMRGGGPVRLKYFLRDKYNIKIPFITHGRILATISIFLLTWLYTGNLQFASIFGIGYLMWATEGWGSYFGIGQNPNSYTYEREVPVIDTILFLLYGPMYSPEEKYVRNKWGWKFSIFPLPFFYPCPPDVILNPRIRDFKWRWYREYTGMCIRGLFCYYPFAVLALINATPIYLLAGASGIILGSLYAAFNNTAFYGQIKWQKTLYGDNIYLNDRIDACMCAEYCAGVWWFLQIAVAWSIFLAQ